MKGFPWIKSFFWGFGVMLSGFSYAQYEIVTLNKRNNFPEEPSIFINLKNPEQILAGSNTQNCYFSGNGGKTWEEKIMREEDAAGGSDPDGAWDTKGDDAIT